MAEQLGLGQAADSKYAAPVELHLVPHVSEHFVGVFAIRNANRTLAFPFALLTSGQKS